MADEHEIYNGDTSNNSDGDSPRAGKLLKALLWTGASLGAAGSAGASGLGSTAV